MSWKLQKVFSAVALAAALLVNCLPPYSAQPQIQHTAAVTP
jgi:hypothetical protein